MIPPVPRPGWLTDARVVPPVVVPATIIRHFPPERLDAVESVWETNRVVLSAAMEASGGHLESAHWDWRAKRERVESGELVLVAVEAEEEVQGLIALDRLPRQSILTPGQSVAYVDYIESAPWNLRAPSHPPRFLGAGTALITEAVRLSLEWGLNGRVGLHSLPQAEPFYENRCGMRRVGCDPNYYDLTYFEYPDSGAGAWLASLGYSE